MPWSSPDDSTRYTQGPDCDSGPGCCCHKCSFFTLTTNCDNTVCCKCVPKYLCAVFTPHDPDAECPVLAGEINFNGGTWQGGMKGIDPTGVDNSIEISMQQIGQYSQCYFLVRMPARDIEDLYLIEGGKQQCTLYPEFRMKCRDPYFVYEDFEVDGCLGTLVIERKELAKVPFSTQILTDSTITSEESETAPCGACSEWCRILCLEWSIGGESQKSEFRVVDDGSASIYWTHKLPSGGTATITVEDIEGLCHFVIAGHTGLGAFDKIPIPYQMCNLGMVIEYNGTGENASKWVSLSCNKCSCWDYICETCRCVCKTMCVVSVDGTQQTDVHYYDLEWDPHLLRWGTDEKWIGIRANPTTGNCEYVISGWNDADSDTELIDYASSTLTIEECGKDMLYFVTTDSAAAFESGVFRFEYGVCKSCHPDCFTSFCDDCCTECVEEKFPETLYFDLRGSPIAGNPEGEPRCLDISDIQLVGTAPLFAEKHRWEGHAIISCLTPMGSPVGPHPNRIDIVITCNGTLWELTVRLACQGESGSIVTIQSNNPIWTIAFGCSPIAWVGVLSSDLVSGCCCSGVFQFEFAVSE